MVTPAASATAPRPRQQPVRGDREGRAPDRGDRDLERRTRRERGGQKQHRRQPERRGQREPAREAQGVPWTAAHQGPQGDQGDRAGEPAERDGPATGADHRQSRAPVVELRGSGVAGSLDRLAVDVVGHGNAEAIEHRRGDVGGQNEAVGPRRVRAQRRTALQAGRARGEQAAPRLARLLDDQHQVVRTPCRQQAVEDRPSRGAGGQERGQEAGVPPQPQGPGQHITRLVQRGAGHASAPIGRNDRLTIRYAGAPGVRERQTGASHGPPECPGIDLGRRSVGPLEHCLPSGDVTAAAVEDQAHARHRAVIEGSGHARPCAHVQQHLLWRIGPLGRRKEPERGQSRDRGQPLDHRGIGTWWRAGQEDDRRAGRGRRDRRRRSDQGGQQQGHGRDNGARQNGSVHQKAAILFRGGGVSRRHQQRAGAAGPIFFREMAHRNFVKFTFLKVDPAWRRLPPADREAAQARVPRRLRELRRGPLSARLLARRDTRRRRPDALVGESRPGRHPRVPRRARPERPDGLGLDSALLPRDDEGVGVLRRGAPRGAPGPAQVPVRLSRSGRSASGTACRARSACGSCASTSRSAAAIR